MRDIIVMHKISCTSFAVTEGNDDLSGGAGQDTYIFNYGDGIDHVYDNKNERNIIRFGAGINKDDVKLHLGSLMVDTGAGFGIHIEGFDRNDVFNSSSISSFEFADGSTLTIDELLARGFDLDGTGNGDIITGTNTTDRITGHAGDDSLSGGAGNDTYIFNRGDGHDTISENDTTLGNIDTIRFGDCIAAGDIALALDGRDLILNNTVTGDRITIKDYAVSEASQIERVTFEDGTAWDAAYLHAQIAALLPAATAGDDVIQGWAGQGVALQGLGGNDTLLGTLGGDTYLFNRGDGQDTILDASGMDVIRFGGGIAAIRWRNHAFIIEGSKAANDGAAHAWGVAA